MKIHLIVSMLVLSVFSFPINAGIDVYEFSNTEAEDKYRFLIRELRCPKCQNQDISDSNAPIAQDMRKQVHRLVEEGESTDFIIDFMVERFGEFVSYRPVVDERTYALWYGPIALAGLGVLLIVMLSRSRKSKSDEEVSLSADEQKALDDAMREVDISNRKND